jgi:hypothetical protein
MQTPLAREAILSWGTPEPADLIGEIGSTKPECEQASGVECFAMARILLPFD